LTGLPREIEIWFALRGAYMLSGGRDGSQWVKNIQRQPAVSVRIGQRRFTATARILTGGEEDGLARRLLIEKYVPRDKSDDLTERGSTALPVAVDLDWT